MKEFKYYQPTEILFGAGRIVEAGQAAARFGRRCLIVTEPAFPALAPLLQKVQGALKAKEIPFDDSASSSSFTPRFIMCTTIAPAIVSTRIGAGEQPGLDLYLLEVGGQRPEKARLSRPPEVLRHRPHAHPAGPGNRPVRQTLVLESQNLAQLSHQ